MTFSTPEEVLVFRVHHRHLSSWSPWRLIFKLSFHICCCCLLLVWSFLPPEGSGTACLLIKNMKLGWFYLVPFSTSHCSLITTSSTCAKIPTLLSDSEFCIFGCSSWPRRPPQWFLNSGQNKVEYGPWSTIPLKSYPRADNLLSLPIILKLLE